MEVQKKVDGEWKTVLTDTDPYTTFKCSSGLIDTGYDVTVGWLLKGSNFSSGTYRLVYNGIAKTNDITDSYKAFSVASSEFKVSIDNPFVDISKSSVYYDAVMWAYNHEPQITNGFDATHFCPDYSCTRGQAVTFIWRAAGCPQPKGACPFEDVDSSSPFCKAIAWASEQGIAKGFDASHFKPAVPVSRAQLVTFLWRYEGQPSSKASINGFKDASDIAAAYQPAVKWAVEKGITVGYADNSFRPNIVCPRWAVVLFMQRTFA